MAVKKDIDFFAFARADSEIISRNDKSFPMVLPIGIAVLLVLISWWIFSWLNLNAGRKLSGIGAALSGVKASAEVSGENKVALIEDMLHMELDYHNSARLNSNRLKELFALQPDDLEVLGVAYYDGQFTMDCFSKRELCGADFAKLLRETDAFSGVNYTGVTSSDGGYSFSLSFYCTGETESSGAEGGQ